MLVKKMLQINVLQTKRSSIKKRIHLVPYSYNKYNNNNNNNNNNNKLIIIINIPSLRSGQ
jgi:hypothetical protein